MAKKKMNEDAIIHFRLSKELKAIAEQQAKSEARSISSWLKKLILENSKDFQK